MESHPQPTRRLVYVVSEELAKISSLLPSNPNRSILVHSLASAFRLFKTDGEGRPGLRVLRPEPATQRELLLYHSRDYVDFVLDPENSNSGENERSNTGGDFGLEDDCPPFRGLSRYVPLVAGATLTGAKALRENTADIAICWDGGRHHAQKSRASGFCYVADCILAVMYLKRLPPPPDPSAGKIDLRKPRVMYLDLDLHFSDSVSQAFSTPVSSVSPSQVLTLSIHHAAPGFFPVSPLAALPTIADASGSTSAPPCDPFTLSIPLQRGACARTFARIWPLVEQVKSAFEPDFVVLQCGADGLAGDPCATWNWHVGPYEEEGTMSWCIRRVIDQWGCKTLLLGGGGYDSPNTARAWTYLTSTIMARQLPMDADIPDHPAFPLYAPSFTLDVPAGFMPDENNDAYLNEVEACFSAHVVPALRKAMSTGK